MTEKDKKLLLTDLCARLPYETWVQYDGKEWLVTGYGHGRVSLLPSVFSSVGGPCPLVEEVRPYLRPMSSMTEEEKTEYATIIVKEAEQAAESFTFGIDGIDWLNAHHFDFRNLIKRGLAIDCTNLNIY